MEMKCVGLDLKYWNEVKVSILTALKLDGGRLSVDDIKSAVEAKEMQLWGLHDGELKAVMVTEIVDYKQLRAIRVVTVSGHSMDSWLDVLIDTVTRWGAEKGAHVIEFIGRKGWEKTLTRKGFGDTQIFMTKHI